MHDFIVSIYSFGIRHGWKKGTLNLAHKSRWSQQCAHINHQFISIGMVSTKWIADLHIYNSGWIYLFVYTRMCVYDLDRMAYVCVRVCIWAVDEIPLKRIKSSTAFHFSWLRYPYFRRILLLQHSIALDWFFFGCLWVHCIQYFCLRNSSFCYAYILFLFAYLSIKLISKSNSLFSLWKKTIKWADWSIDGQNSCNHHQCKWLVVHQSILYLAFEFETKCLVVHLNRLMLKRTLASW